MLMTTLSVATQEPVEAEVLPLLRRAALRYLPLLFLCYVVSIIDRVNVGFAKTQMQQALQFSDTVYGLGAGIFFIGYFFFEVPSNMVLARVGARVWLARILIMWGPVAAAVAFVQTPTQFYMARFLLGVLEAGFFPGAVLLLTYWFPSERRTRYIAMLMLGVPAAGIIVAPLSAAIMAGMHGTGGLAGWQWMLVLQGLPAVVLGALVLWRLDDTPAKARWLTDEEKAVLRRAVREPAPHKPWRRELALAFTQRQVWLPTLAAFFLVGTANTFALWGPQFLQDILSTDIKGISPAFATYFLTAAVAMVLIGRMADRSGRREKALLALLVTGSMAFFVAASFAGQVPLAVVATGVGVVCFVAAMPVFWGCLTPHLAPSAAAATIALVNSLANLGGAVGPALVGPIKQNYGLAPSLATLGVSLALAALFALSLRRRGL